MVEEGDKDMGIARTVEESRWGKERERVRLAKKERNKVMVEGEGRVERLRRGWGRGAPHPKSTRVQKYYHKEMQTNLYDN